MSTAVAAVLPAVDRTAAIVAEATELLGDFFARKQKLIVLFLLTYAALC